MCHLLLCSCTLHKVHHRTKNINEKTKTKRQKRKYHSRLLYNFDFILILEGPSHEFTPPCVKI